MSGAGSDPIVEARRAEITATDLVIVEQLNRRVRLVAELHAHKRSAGHPIRDLDRERRLLERLDEANPGPLSRDALHRLYGVVLEICTAEAARLAAEPAG
jgi:chorismate mutase